MPAPSPPGLKSSIEYFAMSVGIGQRRFLEWVGKAVPDDVQKTYSADQLATLSRMSIGMIRELSQLSLLDERNGRFGFRDLASARQIAKLLNDGVRLMLIPAGGFGWVIGDREVATAMDLPGQLFALGENLGNLARLGVADEVAPVPPNHLGLVAIVGIGRRRNRRHHAATTASGSARVSRRWPS